MKQLLKSCLKIGAIIMFVLFLSQCSNSPARHTSVTAETETQTEEAEEIAVVEEIPIFIPSPDGVLPVTEFGEIWAYVVAGREAALIRGLPLTDVAYFGAEIDSYGALTDVPRRSNISFPGRVHFVVVCNSRSLTHFVLRPGSSERRALIADLIAVTRNYDGLQIDFENIPARDGEAFLSFLRELREGLPDKMFTIALPARTRRIANDVYDYQNILPLVDRILVMAYDEHWSGSAPGSVASLDWCRRVAEYSLSAIGPEKLIMGLPFYGRAWGDYTPSRALIHSTIDGIIKSNEAEVTYRNGIPYFEYSRNVTVRVYFEDEYSLSTRMEMYRGMNVQSVGFWRLGQETAAIWNYLKVKAN